MLHTVIEEAMKLALLVLPSLVSAPLAHAQITESAQAVGAQASAFNASETLIGTPLENPTPIDPSVLNASSLVGLGATSAESDATSALVVQLDQQRAWASGSVEASLAVDGQSGATLDSFAESRLAIDLGSSKRLRIKGALLRYEEVLGQPAQVNQLHSRVDVILIGEDGSFQLWEAPSPSLAAEGPEVSELLIDQQLAAGRYDLIIRSSVSAAVGVAQFVEPSTAEARYDLQVDVLPLRSSNPTLRFEPVGSLPTALESDLPKASGIAMVVTQLEPQASAEAPFVGHGDGLEELAQRPALAR
ncbi:MAG: hypothetical protein AAFZ65_15190 [Planctomycetota bacterium]